MPPSGPVRTASTAKVSAHNATTPLSRIQLINAGSLPSNDSGRQWARDLRACLMQFHQPNFSVRRLKVLKQRQAERSLASVAFARRAPIAFIISSNPPEYAAASRIAIVAAM